MALGSTCRAPLTSSAIEPADSKPTKEKPMNATMVRKGPKSQPAPCAVPAPLNRNENECVRWKKISAMPIPSEAISSAVIDTYSRPRRNFLPIMFAIDPKIRMPSASRLVWVCVSEFSPIAGPKNWAANKATVARAMVSPQL